MNERMEPPAAGVDKSEAQKLAEQGRLYYRQGELDEALAHLQRAHGQYKATGDLNGVAETANDIGVLYTVLRRRSEAEKWLHEAHRMFVEMQDYDGEAQTLGNLGSMFRAMGDLKQAAANLQLAAARFHLVGDDDRRSATLKVLSIVRLQQLRFFQSLAAYEAALACHPHLTIVQKFLRRLFATLLRVWPH